jgi:hypothetical protein
MNRSSSVGVLLGCVVGLMSATLCLATPLDRMLETIPWEAEDAMALFTDWSQIKAALGLGGLSSESPLDVRLQFLNRTLQDQAAGSAYGMQYARSHAQEWGWDTADLDWEANIITRNLPPAYVLKFRDGFDFAPVIEHFSARGFTQTESHGATVFSHELDVRTDWARTTELAIHTTAYVPGDGMLILSSFGVEPFVAALAGEVPSLDEDPFACAAVAHLAEPSAAILAFGTGECVRFTPNPILELLGTNPTSKRIEALRKTMEERQLLVPYRVFGVGYRSAEGRPLGTLLFEYDTPELAEQEVFARCTLARDGMSTDYEAPIAESYFTVLDCQVQDSAAVLSVAPVNDQPWRLFRAVLYRDAVFAACAY